MRYNEVSDYIPVFENDETKQRQLRTDFGSRKIMLACTKCSHEFAKRIGPNTSASSCPDCGCNRVQPAISEITKKKLAKVKENIVDGDKHSAVKGSLVVINNLHGRKDAKSVKMMKEALTALLSIEQGLGSRKKELKEHISEGTGKEEFADIASKLGHELFKDEQ